MVNAPSLTHAFDALDEGTESKRVVKETVAWLVDRLVSPPPSGPKPSVARKAVTHVYGQEFEAAAEEYRKALQADPKDAEAARGFATSLARAGRSREAVGELRKVIGLGIDDAGIRSALGQALLGSGEIAAGAAELKTAVEKGASPAVLVQAGMAPYQRHDYATAIAVWEAVMPLADPAGRRTILFNLACSHALASERDKALSRLDEAVDAGFGPRAAIEGDEDLATLRGDARYAAILGRVKAAP
jgi:tetratricopeptide (TPR) repeat protein